MPSLVGSEMCIRDRPSDRDHLDTDRDETRGARFVAVCVEVVAVAGLMWVS